MKKYKGMTTYYRGLINNQIIEAETDSVLLRLASRIANQTPKVMDMLYYDFISVDENMNESTPLPKQYYRRVNGGKWEYKGNVPERYLYLTELS